VKLKPRRGLIRLHKEEEKRPVRIIADAAIATGGLVMADSFRSLFSIQLSVLTWKSSSVYTNFFI
jgi:hypothetical protein